MSNVETTTHCAAVELWLGNFTKPNTRRDYGREIARFAAWLGRPLATARMLDFQRFRDGLGLAPRSVRRAFDVLRSFYGFAARRAETGAEWGAALADLREVEMPAINRRPGRGLMQSDIEAMARGASSELDRAVIVILYGAGLRVSELCGLCWGDVEQGPDAQGRPAAVLQLREGKTGQREARLPAWAWAELQELGYTRGASDDPLVSKQGVGLSRYQVARITERCAKHGGATAKASPHTLRHSHARHALAQGGGERVLPLVQKQLGHGSLSTTGLYLDSAPGESSGDYLRLPVWRAQRPQTQLKLAVGGQR